MDNVQNPLRTFPQLVANKSL